MEMTNIDSNEEENQIIEHINLHSECIETLGGNKEDFLVLGEIDGIK